MNIRRAGCLLPLLLLLGVCPFSPGRAQAQTPQQQQKQEQQAAARAARKGLAGKKGPAIRRMPPGSRLDAFMRMTPEQQERFLKSLPPPRQAQMRQMLGRWRDMTPEERTRARQSLGEFRDLPLERQRRVRMLYGQFNSLPADRQPVLRDELKGLRTLDQAARQTRLDSEEFRGRYSPAERRLLGSLSEALSRPDYGPGEEEQQ